MRHIGAFFMKFLRVFIPPAIKSVLEEDLYQSERDRLLAAANREHYAATERMLTARSTRIRAELATLERPESSGSVVTPLKARRRAE